MADPVSSVIQPPPVIVSTLVVGQGPSGAAIGGDKTYVHDQAVAADIWTVNHGLGKMPAVTIVDSAGDEVEGGVQHVSTAQLVITFSAPFAGAAYCN